MLLVTLAALFASAPRVSAAMATAIFERRVEVGLMKALGAGNLSSPRSSLRRPCFSRSLAALLILRRSAARPPDRPSIFNSQIPSSPCSSLILAIAVIVTLPEAPQRSDRAVKFDPLRTGE